MKDLTPQKILTIVLRHIKLIVLIAILTTLITYGYSKFFITPTYTASAMLFVQNYDENATQPTSFNTGKADISSISASATLAKQCVYLFTNSPDMTNIASGAYVSITTVDESNFLRITATAPNAQQAANVVNQLADQAPKCFASYYDNNGKISTVTSATPPSIPSSPNVKQNTLYGVVIGIVLGVLLSLFLEIIDTTIKAGDDLAKMYKLPVFAEIVDFEQEG